jgi:MYXO-CTERM domain-containing protein
MRPAAIVSIAVLVIALVLSPLAAAPAWAHDGRVSVLDLVPTSSVADSPLLAALGAVAGLGLGRRRRLALALALALPLLGFEIGLHSVHHLGDPDHASQCVVAEATTHVNGALVDAPRPINPIEYTPQPAPVAPAVAAPHRSLAPHEGRAPPVVLA